jgi:uncharacterized protein
VTFAEWSPVDLSGHNLLHLIIMPTERCNFRCVYCYEEFAFGRMGPAVVTGLENLLSRRASSLDQLTIGWFGGEPLLALDILERVQTHALGLVRAHPGIDFHASVTTNGYLLDRERFEHLLNLGVHQYQITFDGPRHVHDRRRVSASGGGTFDRIWENVAGMREVGRDFDALIRIHVDRVNQHGLPDFLEWLHASLGGDDRFRLALRPLFCGGGPAMPRDVVLDDAQAREVVARISDRVSAQGVRLYKSSPSDEMCCAARPNSFVVRASGELAKCPVDLTESRNCVGRLLEDGRVTVDGEKLKMWIRGLWTQDPVDLACPLHANARSRD